MEKAVEAIRKVGRVAFEGLLKNQLIFIKEEMEACDEAAAVACHVGILTHGGEVGKSVLEALCKKIDDIKFIIQCAFECHNSEAIGPVRNLLNTETYLTLASLFVSVAALFFTLESIGKEVVRRSSSIRATLGVSEFFESNESSSDVAAAVGLFTLQNLRELYISERLDDKFYLGMSAAASQSKIEKLTYWNTDLGYHASSHYARGICFMPNLRSLYMFCVELSDEFYSTMATEASQSKIEKLKHAKADLGSAASHHYARGLCSMPNLQSLNLNDVGLSDEFYSTMASEASRSKIQTLDMEKVSITPCRLHSILSLPCLQSLSLTDIRSVDIDDGETLTRQITSVDELSVDGKHVTSLWNLGLHSSCPRVKTLILYWLDDGENVSSDIVTMACSPFHHLTHLHTHGCWFSTSTTLNDPVSFCKAVITSCPRLTKLSITRVVLYINHAAEIIQLMKTHPNLASIELHWCGTDADLDPLISEVNSEGKLTVTVKHGWF
eukprot:XP_011680866.1 PREDICTED: uncharacterized protein LOC105446137 [Strongylocentrotus purpuratus]